MLGERLPCFCEKQLSNEVDPGTLYDGSHGEQPICENFVRHGILFMLANQGITLFIIIVNMFLTNYTVDEVKDIGERTYSKRYKVTSDWVFIATWFNTAIVIQIANSYKGKGGWLSTIFNGQFNDYSYDWYGNVGN